MPIVAAIEPQGFDEAALRNYDDADVMGRVVCEAIEHLGYEAPGDFNFDCACLGCVNACRQLNCCCVPVVIGCAPSVVGIFEWQDSEVS